MCNEFNCLIHLFLITSTLKNQDEDGEKPQLTFLQKKGDIIIVTSIFCTMLILLFNPGKWRSKQFGVVLVQVN